MEIKGKLCIDAGCGENVQPGFIGMDKRKLPGVDIVHDIEVMPWPVDAGAASVIKMSHVVEHIKPWLTIDLIDECWRVLEVGGTLAISTPYGGSARFYQDPTHCNGWTEATLAYFDPREVLYSIYKPKPWYITYAFWRIHGDVEATLEKMKEAEGGQENGKN